MLGIENSSEFHIRGLNQNSKSALIWPRGKSMSTVHQNVHVFIHTSCVTFFFMDVFSLSIKLNFFWSTQALILRSAMLRNQIHVKVSQGCSLLLFISVTLTLNLYQIVKKSANNNWPACFLFRVHLEMGVKEERCPSPQGQCLLPATEGARTTVSVYFCDKTSVSDGWVRLRGSALIIRGATLVRTL